MALISPIKVMTPFINGLKYNSKDLYFAIFDHKEGRIYEISKNFITLLNDSGV